MPTAWSGSGVPELRMSRGHRKLLNMLKLLKLPCGWRSDTLAYNQSSPSMGVLNAIVSVQYLSKIANTEIALVVVIYATWLINCLENAKTLISFTTLTVWADARRIHQTATPVTITRMSGIVMHILVLLRESFSRIICSLNHLVHKHPWIQQPDSSCCRCDVCISPQRSFHLQHWIQYYLPRHGSPCFVDLDKLYPDFQSSSLRAVPSWRALPHHWLCLLSSPSQSLVPQQPSSPCPHLRQNHLAFWSIRPGLTPSIWRCDRLSSFSGLLLNWDQVYISRTGE